MHTKADITHFGACPAALPTEVPEKGTQALLGDSGASLSCGAKSGF